jgi:hypothetical protein
MATWSDSAGRDWVVNVTVTTIRRVKELVDVNLLDVFDGKLFARLLTDPVALVESFYAICQPQAEARAVTYEQFVDSMTGDGLDRAFEALTDALICFFPKGRREILLRLKMTATTTDAAALTMAVRKIDSPEAMKAREAELAKLEREIDARLRLLGEGSQNAPASAG